MTAGDDGPKLPETYYQGSESALAEQLGQALSSVESILRTLLGKADLTTERKDFHQRDLNAISQVAVWLDRNSGPG